MVKSVAMCTWFAIEDMSKLESEEEDKAKFDVLPQRVKVRINIAELLKDILKIECCNNLSKSRYLR